MNVCPILFLLYIAAGVEVEKRADRGKTWKETVLASEAGSLPSVVGNETTIPNPHTPLPTFLEGSHSNFHGLATILEPRFSSFLLDWGCLPLCEIYEGLLCLGRKIYTPKWVKSHDFCCSVTQENYGLSKGKMQLCNSFLTAVMFQGDSTIMSFPCF